jgi:hypothetical protein
MARGPIENTGRHRALVLVAVLSVIAPTAFLLRCTHAQHRSNGVIRFGMPPANSMRLFVSPGLRFLVAEPRLLQEINPLASLA